MARSKNTPTEKSLEPVETLEETATEIVADEDLADEIIEGEEPSDPVIAEEPEDTPDAEEEPEAIEQTPSEDVATPEVQAPKARSGFGGLLLGGVIAAVIGAGATYYVLPRVPGLIKDPALNERVDAAQSQAQAASEQAAQAGVKLDALEPRIAGLENVPGPQEALAALEEKLAALEGRVQELEARPVPSATASQETQDAVDRAIEDMRTELRKELDIVAAEKAAATDVQNAATKNAAEAAARATFAKISAAIESGQPFAQLLSEMEQRIAVPPAALKAIATKGAPTVADLQARYPAAARAALSASISATPGDTAQDRFGTFLRSQLGVRSLEPREGDDPDAILSRAEAALKQADLASALQEISALPADGQAELAEWVGLAQTRLDAENALAELAAQLAQ